MGSVAAGGGGERGAGVNPQQGPCKPHMPVIMMVAYSDSRLSGESLDSPFCLKKEEGDGAMGGRLAAG
jgi:hypothetical protein